MTAMTAVTAVTAIVGRLGRQVSRLALRQVQAIRQVRAVRLSLQTPQGEESRRRQAAPAGLSSSVLAALLRPLLARALLLWRWIL